MNLDITETIETVVQINDILSLMKVVETQAEVYRENRTSEQCILLLESIKQLTERSKGLQGAINAPLRLATTLLLEQ